MPVGLKDVQLMRSDDITRRHQSLQSPFSSTSAVAGSEDWTISVKLPGTETRLESVTLLRLEYSGRFLSTSSESMLFVLKPNTMTRSGLSESRDNHLCIVVKTMIYCCIPDLGSMSYNSDCAKTLSSE